MATKKKQAVKTKELTLEQIVAGLPKGIKMLPPQFVDFTKKTEVYHVSTARHYIGIGVNFESGTITLHRPGGAYDFVFKGSQPELALEITELMMFAAQKGKEILDAYKVEHPREINEASK